MVAMMIMAVLMVAVVPSLFRTRADLRLKGDGRGIAQAVGVTKMRAAARFTRARLFVDLANRAYYPQIWDTATNTWVTEDMTSSLSQGVSFGFAGLDTPPTGTQNAIQQSNACTDAAGAAIPNTACIAFNSRGIPINPANGSPQGGNAFYITDGTAVFATTVTATPLVRLWWSPANTVAWVQQ